MIKAIIFDAFGTLFKVTGGASARKIISYIEETGQVVCEKAFMDEWKSFYREKTLDSAGFLTEREMFISRIKMFYERYGVLRDPENDADDLLKEAHFREVYDDALPALERLKKNHSVFIGSNSDNDVLYSVMEKSGMETHKVYTSESLRCYKPSPRFYTNILEENGLRPCEVLFVGDSLTDDIYGPNKVGIKTCWVNRTGAKAGVYVPDHVVENLLEIEECLKMYR